MASESFIHCCFRSFSHFQVAHTTKSILKVNTTNIFLRSNTLRPKTFSGLTPARQKFFSRVAHMTNSFSGRRHPNISSGRTYDQNLSQIEHIRTFPQVEHMTKIFLTSNDDQTSFLGRTQSQQQFGSGWTNSKNIILRSNTASNHSPAETCKPTERKNVRQKAAIHTKDTENFGKRK